MSLHGSREELRRLRVDRTMYGRFPLLLEPAYLAVASFRLLRAAVLLPRPARFAAIALAAPPYLVARLLTGIDIPPRTDIGEGFRIFHFGGVVINGGSVIGARCRLRQGVTVGVKETGGPAPRLGDDVFIGAYAQIIGGVSVGDGARIGAMSLVLHDVRDGATVVGNPAREISA